MVYRTRLASPPRLHPIAEEGSTQATQQRSRKRKPSDPLFTIPKLTMRIRRKTPPSTSLSPIVEEGNAARNLNFWNGRRLLPMRRGPPPITNLAFQGAYIVIFDDYP
ncbi:hypothetical protein MRX96_024093 [Rhipicephalus microplus]